MAGYKVYRVVRIGVGVSGNVKNLIFAANGPKPEIVLSDAVNNDVQIIKNAEYCLVYDLPIPQTGLMWSDLVTWWAGMKGNSKSSIDTERDLIRRLIASLDPNSKPERLLFDTYYRVFRNQLGEKLPALIPQVYLHYDPYTLRHLGGSKRLVRQRMDFLILFSNHDRVVVEVDGKQHYANANEASPQKYAEMVAADRELHLAGYEVYRFGGYELDNTNAGRIIEDFFTKLLRKHRIV
jgi:very-short-patch-repair endonuclease